MPGARVAPAGCVGGLAFSRATFVWGVPSRGGLVHPEAKREQLKKGLRTLTGEARDGEGGGGEERDVGAEEEGEDVGLEAHG